MPTKNNYYSKALRPFARKLRSTSTHAEIKVWREVLRAKQMKGYGFLRQRPILNYTADFMCKELKLIIEVDGSSHEHEEIRNRDLVKQRELEKAGFTVIRFSDYEVFKNIDQVRQVLESWINEFDNNSSP